METPAFQTGGISTYLVKVDTYQSGELHGRLDNVRFSSERSFASSFNLLQQIQELLDTSQCPGAEPTRSVTALYQPLGTAATFQLEILFTQNHSWQGKVKWLEQRTEATFRSVLELLTTLDAALAA